jgi:Arc/MetJ family transcription regulator
MRTTLDLDQELLRGAQEATGVKVKTQVIEMGLQALIEQAARRRLAAMRGAIPQAKSAPRRRARAS